MSSNLLEMERNLLVGQLSINTGISSSPPLHISLILTLQINLQNPTAIHFTSSPLAFNLGRIYNIFQNSILHSGKRPTARSDSLCSSRSRLVFAKNGALCNNEYMGTREFLLQFPYKTSLNGMKGFEEFIRDVDDDSLVGSTINFLGGGNV